MKAKHVLLAVFLASACVMRAATNDLTALLQKGLFEEEANHNLDAAIQAYQSAIGEHDKDRKLVATAVFRLGECLRKQGKTNEAALEYERVMREYSDQETLVKLSAANLGGRAREASEVPGMSENTPELKALETAYQEIAPKAIAARALAERMHKLNPDQLLGFFTTIRPDQTMAALGQALQNQTTKLASLTSTYGPNNENLRAAEAEKKQILKQIDDRAATLAWAINNDAASLTDQEASLRKEMAAARQSLTASQTPASEVQASAQLTGANSTAEEDEEIRKIKVLVQYSPDLINAGSPTPLQEAAEKGHLRVAEFLLANGADVSVPARNGETPLHNAARHGHRAMVELLLNKGANPDAGGPLNIAVELGFKSVVEVLLAHKANVNLGDRRPLHYAAEKGNRAIAEMLIARGAEIDAKDENGRTALIAACEHGQIEMAQLLLDHKADVNAADVYKFTPLHWIAQYGNLELAKSLLAKGANVEASTSSRLAFGPTPLTWAIANQKPEMVRLLLENHADANIKFRWDSGNGSLTDITPLLLALKRYDNEPIVDFLLAHGAEADAKSKDPSYMPLLLAVAFQRNDSLQALVKHKANLNVTGWNNTTAYNQAVWSDNSRAVEILSDAGADINLNENSADTALHCAVQRANIKMASLLISRKANVNAMNGNGQPPLSYTKGNFATETQTRMAEIADMLIKAGADVNYERATRISLKPAGGERITAIFYRGTNAFNHYTLADLIAADYSINRRNSGNPNPPYGTVPFPDFANVSINRLQTDGTLPKHETTRNDYKERILRVLTHIQEHLDETLDLEELAGVACFSSFHFHRIFAAMTGETIADHVRRLRLERAAMELRSGARRVIQVALDAGYEAHEAFTRAFKAAYGVSPAQFRRATGPIAVRPAPSGVHFRQGVPLTTFNTNHITTKVMKVIIKKIKPLRVAYLRHVGPYGNVKQTGFDLMARLTADKQIRKSSAYIGIGHDDPSVTPASELRFDACFTVNEEYEPTKPVQVQTIVGGDYAVAKNCPVGEIKDAYHYLFGKWLAQSSRELRSAPSFVMIEHAQDAFARKKQQMDIYMPLQPKRSLTEVEQLNIEVKTLEPHRVAYMRRVGPYNESYRVWFDFKTNLKKDGLPRKDSLLLGVPLDNPKETPPEKLRYDACVTVDEDYAPTKPVRVRTISGGDYVVARNCPRGAIATGYKQLFQSWLPKSGRKARKAPSFLVAVNSPEGMPPAFGLTDIYVPLEPAK